MIHQYKNNGYNIVLDVNSGSVHVVDELVYEVIELLLKKCPERKIVQTMRRIVQEVEGQEDTGEQIKKDREDVPKRTVSEAAGRVSDGSEESEELPGTNLLTEIMEELIAKYRRMRSARRCRSAGCSRTPACCFQRMCTRTRSLITRRARP